MLTQEIRRKFLQYFRQKDHTIVPSAPVLPHDDPTLLFINAGMNQFKDVFLGNSIRDYTRAASSQKCIRVGGKHNDLENVGHTRRHLTFFEMLGNFSFGDYFKEEAIQFAWEVSTEVFGFEPERIWPTVFTDDDEAFEIWKKYVPENRITRFGEKQNFWAMGDTGPCGPCSELLYDRGEKYGSGKTPLEDKEETRFLEFWNLVFMQYNRDASKKMNQLPKPSIDTGAGLERVVNLKMDVDSVYDTDLLRGLIAQVENLSGKTYDPESDQAPAFRVIADHLRCLAFAIADGVQPSNVERGYVLRKVLRRAVRYGRTLDLNEPFLAGVLPRLTDLMGEDYSELISNQERIAEILTIEEEAFLRTLKRGGNILNQIMDHAKTHGKEISGDEAFKLKDTYGFPLEEIQLLAIDSDLTVDTKRFEELEVEAKERSRKVHKTTQQIASENLFVETDPSEFLGYSQLEADGKVVGLVVEDQFVDEIRQGQQGIVLLDRTPFYAEKGGQVGDTGMLRNENVHFDVTNCQEPYKGVIAHVGIVKKGRLQVGETLRSSVNAHRRQRIANNHTATHLLHWALHKVLGEHIKQAGSVVDPERFRFDFSHHKALTVEEIRAIEDLVNAKIRENRPVKAYEISYEEAQKEKEIKQFFGDKYGAEVRVIDIDFSKELCGGTHTAATGTIGLFKIAKEGSIAAGIRRIEAVTGPEAEEKARESEDQLQEVADKLKIPVPKLMDRLERMLQENKDLAQELKSVKKGQMKEEIEVLIAKAESVRDFSLLTAELDIPPGDLKEFADSLMDKLGSGVLVLGATNGDKCHLVARVSDDVVAKGIEAKQIIKDLAPIIDGGGGGKANFAQAGGKAPERLAEALSKAKELF